jgi:orotate phosphoribosyltransferase
VDDATLAEAIRRTAYLEGDFVLRSGKRSSYYLDKYRFETVPEILEELGRRISAAASAAEPHASRLAGPELGAVALAAAASLASRLPFLIVRDRPQEHGTANRIEGAFSAGDQVVLVEDVVTSGGAACAAVTALREHGLVVRHAVCVVDRGEGGADALARLAVRLHPLFAAAALRPAGER